MVDRAVTYTLHSVYLPHDFFIRDGYDLRCEIPISFSQATLGAEIEVPTLNGKVALKIPEGTQPGTEFRIRIKELNILIVNDRRFVC